MVHEAGAVAGVRQGEAPADRSAVHSVVVTRSPVFPPVGGVALRVAGNVEALRRLGPVTVISVGAEAQPDEAPQGVLVRGFDRAPRRVWERGRLRLRGLHPRHHPVTSALRHADALAALRSAAAGPGQRGVVVLEEVWMADYLDAARETGWPVVYDAHNVESTLRREMAQRSTAEGARRLREELGARQLVHIETRLARGVDQVWACGDQDRQLLAELRGATPDVHVVPNTVRTFPDGAFSDLSRPPGMTGGPTIVYPAMFGYPPNEEAALLLVEEVLPRLRARGVPVTLLLVGRHPTASMRAAARGCDDVVVTGEVDEVLPYLVHADVVAVPLRSGGGTRLKILEAFAAGVPVVSTGKGAEGLEVVDGRDLLLRDDMAEFAAAVHDVIGDQGLARTLRQGGREVVERDYSWDAAARLVARNIGSLVEP